MDDVVDVRIKCDECVWFTDALHQDLLENLILD